MKRKIKCLIQFLLLCYMVCQGFTFTYLTIWAIAGLPVGWWMLPICVMLGVLSLFGFNTWVSREEANHEQQ